MMSAGELNAESAKISRVAENYVAKTWRAVAEA